MHVDIGLDKKHLQDAVALLKVLLADEFMLYCKLRNYHWNVEGANFLSFHKLFESQYEKLAEIIDSVAERIRMLGAKAPGTTLEFQELSHFKEKKGHSEKSQEMVEYLLHDHEVIIRFLRKSLEELGDHLDSGTEDFCVALIQQHESMAWFLRSHLA